MSITKFLKMFSLVGCNVRAAEALSSSAGPSYQNFSRLSRPERKDRTSRRVIMAAQTIVLEFIKYQGLGNDFILVRLGICLCMCATFRLLTADHAAGIRIELGSSKEWQHENLFSRLMTAGRQQASERTSRDCRASQINLRPQFWRWW